MGEIMKNFKAYRLSILMSSCILLQSCSSTSLPRKHLNNTDVNKLIDVLNKNSNLNEEEKQVLIEYTNILKTLSYVDAKSLEKVFSRLDIVYDNCSINVLSSYDAEQANITICDKSSPAFFYQLFYLLHGDNNGKFMNKAVSSVLAKEYGNDGMYPFHEAIAQIFIEIYGSDFILKSYMTDKNLLKDKISKTTDSELSKILFEYLEEYEELSNYKFVTEEKLKSKQEVIISLIEVIYGCEFNQSMNTNQNIVGLISDLENKNYDKEEKKEKTLSFTYQSESK